MFPQSSILQCEACAKAGGLYDWGCYSCRVRHLSRAPKHVRVAAYREIYQWHGQAFMDVVRDDVTAYAKRGRAA